MRYYLRNFTIKHKMSRSEGLLNNGLGRRGHAYGLFLNSLLNFMGHLNLFPFLFMARKICMFKKREASAADIQLESASEANNFYA